MVCSDPTIDTPLASTVVGSVAVSPIVADPRLDQAYAVSGNTLNILDRGTLGFLTSVTLPGSVHNFPNPVRLDTGLDAVFVGDTSGGVHCIGSRTGGIVWSVSLATAGCRRVSVTATPAVHLLRYASDSFKAKYTTDVVYASTRQDETTCGRVSNQTFALRATNGLILWVFNENGEYLMAPTLQGGWLDTANDTLYVTADTIETDTLWAINTLEGSLHWSRNLGKTWTTPLLRGEHLFVGTVPGDIIKVDRVDGNTVWSFRTGSLILPNIWHEFRRSYAGLITAVGYDGLVRTIRDEGASASLVWETQLPGIGTEETKATGGMNVDPSTGKLYVGANDGRLYQLDLFTGQVETFRTVDPTGGTVGQGHLFIENGDLHLLVGSSNGVIAKFCTPWSAVEPTA